MKNILQMNKRILLSISIFIWFLMTACGGSQKPSERANVWDDTEINEVELSTEKVCVPFKRTAGDLAEVQVSFNGVPFNMLWDTGASMTCISALELQKLAKRIKLNLMIIKVPFSLKSLMVQQPKLLYSTLRRSIFPVRIISILYCVTLMQPYQQVPMRHSLLVRTLSKIFQNTHLMKLKV